MKLKQFRKQLIDYLFDYMVEYKQIDNNNKLFKVKYFSCMDFDLCMFCVAYKNFDFIVENDDNSFIIVYYENGITVHSFKIAFI